MKTIIVERENGTRRVMQQTAPTTRVEQSHRDRCNINTIMRKAHETGFVPTSNTPAHYGDFTNVSDYQTARNRILEADQAFAALPAHIRKRFDNDPSNLIAFIEDENNLQEARELGIVAKEAPQPPSEKGPPTGGTEPPAGEEETNEK